MFDTDIDTTLLSLGSSGMLRGHWNLICVANALQVGYPVRSAILIAARQSGSTPKAVRQHIRSVITRMDRKRTSAYLALLNGKEKLTVDDLLYCLAKML